MVKFRFVLLFFNWRECNCFVLVNWLKLMESFVVLILMIFILGSLILGCIVFSSGLLLMGVLFWLSWIFDRLILFFVVEIFVLNWISFLEGESVEFDLIVSVIFIWLFYFLLNGCINFWIGNVLMEIERFVGFL